MTVKSSAAGKRKRATMRRDRADSTRRSSIPNVAANHPGAKNRGRADADDTTAEHQPFMSSCSTPWCAEYVSWHKPARIPGIRFAAIDAPTPLPQSRMPRSAWFSRKARPTASA